MFETTSKDLAKKIRDFSFICSPFPNSFESHTYFLHSVQIVQTLQKEKLWKRNTLRIKDFPEQSGTPMVPLKS